MQVRVRNGDLFTPATTFDDATSVIIKLGNGTPVAIALDVDGHVVVKTVDNADFADMLDMAGGNRSQLPRSIEKIKT